MPEAPELTVVREVLERRLVGESIDSARIVQPTTLRDLVSGFETGVGGRSLDALSRYGKVLTLTLSGDRFLVVIPMLAGRLWLSAPKDRVRKDTSLILTMSGGGELRYTDDRRMGMVYYAAGGQLADIPRLEESGPDVFDHPDDLQTFKGRLKRFQGEIKGILTRGGLVAGIGNAYADEVLFEAELSPFRKRGELSADDVERLHSAVYSVPAAAVDELRGRMGEGIHLKPRDFLKVHNKGNRPCPRCGGRISQITARRRITSYCLRCQPGLLIRN